MLSTLFTVTIAYEIIKFIVLFIAFCSDSSDVNGTGLLYEFAVSALVIVFAALSISFGGTFAFVLGIIFAVLCGLAMIAHFIGAARGAIANGFWSIYNLVMMILFIVALAL
jgi:hypothetical protein